jgi:lipoate-protein ligase A
MMPNMLLVSDTDNPYMNHAIEDALLTLGFPYDTILFLWINRPSVIVGRNQNPWKEVHVRRAEDLGVDVIRRTSGGGTVYHDWGNLNYSFISYKDTYNETQNFSILQRTLKKHGIGTKIGARKDIFVENYKISGSAFYLKKDRRLHHGTLLIDVDTSSLWDVLKFDGGAIDSRSIASKRSDVINLNQLNEGISIESMIQSIKESFTEEYKQVTLFSLEMILDDYRDFILERATYFSTWQWNFGETPKFKYKIGNKGYLSIKAGKVVAIDGLDSYSHLIGQPFNENSINTND